MSRCWWRFSYNWVWRRILLNVIRTNMYSSTTTSSMNWTEIGFLWLLHRTSSILLCWVHTSPTRIHSNGLYVIWVLMMMMVAKHMWRWMVLLMVQLVIMNLLMMVVVRVVGGVIGVR